MNTASRPVLKLLDDTGVALSATAITYNLEQRMDQPPSRATVTRALSMLKDVGLVHQPSGSLYEITEKGQEYIKGEIDVEEVDDGK